MQCVVCQCASYSVQQQEIKSSSYLFLSCTKAMMTALSIASMTPCGTLQYGCAPGLCCIDKSGVGCHMLLRLSLESANAIAIRICNYTLQLPCTTPERQSHSSYTTATRASPVLCVVLYCGSDRTFGQAWKWPLPVQHSGGWSKPATESAVRLDGLRWYAACDSITFFWVLNLHYSWPPDNSAHVHWSGESMLWSDET